VSAAAEQALIKKLVQQGASFDEAGSDPAFLLFEYRGRLFTVPRPLTDSGWSAAQQNRIATDLEYFGLEFWPLDYN
jgi:hypothetical protein